MHTYPSSNTLLIWLTCWHLNIYLCWKGFGNQYYQTLSNVKRPKKIVPSGVIVKKCTEFNQYRLSKDVQVPVLKSWSIKATRSLGPEGGPELSVPLYRISLHCVGLHCMCGLGRYRGLSDARSGKPSLWIWLTTLWCWDVTAMQYWEFGRNIYCLSSGEMPIQWNAELTNKKIVFEY